MDLVKVEYKAIELMKEGYEFKLVVDSPFVNGLGRTKEVEEQVKVKFSVIVKKQEEQEKLDFEVELNKF